MVATAVKVPGANSGRVPAARQPKAAGRLGIAIIGQAPRADIAALFAAQLPAGTEVVVRGCLDGLDATEIARRPPDGGDDTLYTRLAGTRDVVISKRHVIERAPEALARLRADGAGAIVFACTGDFPPMAGDAGVIFPSRLLSGLAVALLPRGRLGLLVPLAEQIAKLSGKWQRPGVDVVADALLPSGDEFAACQAAERLVAHKPDLVAMDCMSYTPATKAAIGKVLGPVPILLAVTAVSRVVGELLDR